jgi:hypothetical protein
MTRRSAAAPGALARGRRPFRALVALFLLTGTSLLVSAGPAAAHGSVDTAGLPVAARAARAVALAAAVFVAGQGLLRPLQPAPRDSARRLLFVVTLLGAGATAVAPAGGLPVARWSILLPLLPLTAGAVTATRWPAALGAVGLLLVLGWDAFRDGAGAGVLMLGHLATAGIWLAAVTASATAPAGQRAAVLRRLGPVAVGSAVLLAASGVLAAHRENVTVHGITATPFGSLVALKVGLLAAAGLLGLTVRRVVRRGARPATGPARAELVTLLGAAVLGATLTGLPNPGPAPTAGAPLVRRLTIDDAATGLVVVPQRPGLNLVHLQTTRFTDLRVAGKRYAATPRPYADGQWALISLPPGRSRLQVIQGKHVAQRVLNAGPALPAGAPTDPLQLAGPDGPECLAAALGAVLGGSRGPLTGCPAQQLRAADARALTALVGQLAGRGVHTLGLVADSTPRAVAAAAAVRAAASGAGVRVARLAASLPGALPDVVLSVAGAADTRTALAAAADKPPRYGSYVAPWLMDAPLVAAGGGSAFAALPFDPQGDQAMQYLSALALVGPGGGSESGLVAYLAARGVEPAQRIRVWAATSAFTVMPMNDDPAHAHDEDGQGAGWLAGGALTPVSPALS